MPNRIVTCRYLLLLLLSCFLVNSSKGQQEFNFTALTTKSGLSSNTIYLIQKDHNGLIWFGTADGLNKFDGTNFTVYRYDPQNFTSIPSNEILSMYEDHTGRMWVGAGGGGVAYYDYKNNNFVRFRNEKSWPNAATISVRAMCEDHKGNLWIGTYSNELRLINTHTNEVTKISLDPATIAQPDKFVVLKIYEDSKQRIWIGTNNGLYLYNWESGNFAHFQHNNANISGLSDDIIKGIAEDSNGNLWVATLGGGLNLLMKDGLSFRNFRHAEKDISSISSDDIYTMVLSPDNKLWLGTEEGLNIFDIKNYTAVIIKPDKRNIYSLTNKSIRSICIDKKGIYWLGTYQGGVDKYDKNLALFNLKENNAFDPGGLAAPVVTSFAEDQTGNIFVGTDGGGLQLFNRKTGHFRQFEIKSTINSTGHRLSIFALKLDRTGKLWIGTFQDGLFVLNPSTGKYSQILAGKSPANINLNLIYCIEEVSNGDIWIGTIGNGINIYNPKTRTFTKYNGSGQEPGNPVHALNGYISTIAETKQGDIWLGSVGTGIAVFHAKSRTISLYNKANSDLESDAVQSILHDAAGNTWVGATGGGLNFFDKQKQKFFSYSEKDGLENGVIYKIIEDKTGIIWLSTNKGISSFNPVTRKFKNFGVYNGVKASPFVLGAGICLTNGVLFFGGQEGFNYFDPEILPNNRTIPTVLLTDLKVSNITAIPGENGPISEQIAIAKEIRLNYGQNFSLSYIALNYTAPQQNLYSYKLIGLDKDWNFVGSSKTAYYTNLSPGTYEFQVRASNNEGAWSTNITTIRITILPPIWMSVYAYIFYVLIVISLFFYTRFRIIRNIKLRLTIEQEKLQARQLIDQQKRESERLHEIDLLKIKFLTNLSHEFRTPISLILAPADKLLSMKIDENVHSQIQVIKRNARRLLNLVNQLLDFRKMEEQELKLNLAPGELISFIREAAESFQDLSERKKINFQFKTELKTLIAAFDHDKIERIIFNLLSNAFKFTFEGGAIELSLSLTEKKEENDNPLICIKVTDNGIGIPIEKQGKIFDRFFQHNSTVALLNQGSGIGLSITKEFIELHGGKITLESSQGKGCTFTVYLPLDSLGNTEIAALIPEKDQTEEIFSNNESQSVTENNSNKPLMATILLVEDNDDFRFYLKDNLKAYYQIEEASNGNEGWQKTLSSHPQLIVSDISMPHMNGIEFCRKLKSDKRTNHIPVILLTAITGEEDQLKGLETGANDYMTKPFNFEILNAKIKTLLLFNQTLKSTYSKQIQVTGEEIQIESNDENLLKSITLYIEDKLNDAELSVEDLSKHVFMSRSTLYHKLIELTGLTPIEYIRSVKLDKAAVLLEKTDYNVAQIAYMTGFGTPSYFSRMFKAKFQILPSEYKNIKRKNARSNQDSK